MCLEEAIARLRSENAPLTAELAAALAGIALGHGRLGQRLLATVAYLTAVACVPVRAI